jgi:hypothetical protein
MLCWLIPVFHEKAFQFSEKQVKTHDHSEFSPVSSLAPKLFSIVSVVLRIRHFLGEQQQNRALNMASRGFGGDGWISSNISPVRLPG